MRTLHCLCENGDPARRGQRLALESSIFSLNGFAFARARDCSAQATRLAKRVQSDLSIVIGLQISNR